MGKPKVEVQQLKDMQNTDFPRSAVAANTKVGPLYGRRENLTMSFVTGKQNSEHAEDINFFLANLFCRT